MIVLSEWMTFSKPQSCLQFKRSCFDNEDRSSNVDNNSKVVKLLGLPYAAREGEIKTFFNGNFHLSKKVSPFTSSALFTFIDINIESIVIGKDRLGRSSGVAHVKLNSEEDLQKALQKDRDYMGHRLKNN